LSHGAALVLMRELFAAWNVLSTALLIFPIFIASVEFVALALLVLWSFDLTHKFSPHSSARDGSRLPISEAYSLISGFPVNPNGAV
jgi:hypothetical protein